MRVKKGALIYDVENDIAVVVGFTGSPKKANIEKTVDGVVVSRIGNGAFDGCTSLTSITLPDTLTRIGDWAFDGCTSLTSITLPDTLTRIGNCAFYCCTGLTSITLPDTLTHICNFAFRGCTGLTSITLPDTLTHIGNGAFYGCTGLAAKVFSRYIVVPMSGSFSAWKKCIHNGKSVIVELEIPEDALRSSAPFMRKCRASKALVVSMSGGHTTADSKTHTEKSTTYEIGKIVECHEWCQDFWQECAGGIHFFMTREEAKEYT